jgi:4-hydroxy-tetrahydrodipicolinate synthase
VLAGTNGEGPSLSAKEKLALCESAANLSWGSLVLGVATPSLEEAAEMVRHAPSAGADALLLMAPYYFSGVRQDDLASWFLAVLDEAKAPVIIYNFPKMAGVELSGELLQALSAHERFSGVKDSSGQRENLQKYKKSVPNHPLFVGDETLLLEALKAGWTGTISGAANVVPAHLAHIVAAWHEGRRDEAAVAHERLALVLKAIRSAPQPATNKAFLYQKGLLAQPTARLPLHHETAQVEPVLDAERELKAD